MDIDISYSTGGPDQRQRSVCVQSKAGEDKYGMPGDKALGLDECIFQSSLSCIASRSHPNAIINSQYKSGRFEDGLETGECEEDEGDEIWKERETYPGPVALCCKEIHLEPLSASSVHCPGRNRPGLENVAQDILEPSLPRASCKSTLAHKIQCLRSA